MSVSRADVRAFCRSLYAELKSDHWGDIDPFLLKEIAECDRSGSAVALELAIASALNHFDETRQGAKR